MWAWTLWTLPLICRFALADLPTKPENISCVFYYSKNFTCTWSPEKEANFISYTVRRTLYYLHDSDTCTSTSENGSSCSFYSRLTLPDIYIIQVEAQNAYGIIKSDITYWDLYTITKIEPPKISSVKPVLGLKKMVQIKWTQPVLAPKSSTLNYTLRFRAVNSTHWMEVNFTKSCVNEEAAYNLTGLQAFTEYVVALQCVAQKSRFWSGWSQEKMGITMEEAPHGLDLWRVLRSDKVDGKRTVQLLWKKAKGTPVLEKVLGYNIWYFPENNTNLTETMNTTNQQPELYLGNQTYWVHVISYNSLGKSPEATLRIPAIDEKLFQCIEAMHTYLTQDQLVVEWQSSALEVDTWMVEWVPDLDSKPLAISWESVSHTRNWTIQQDELKPFWCYNISVYPMLQNRVGEPYSIQAYVKEGVPSAGPVAKVEHIGVRTATITWKEIPKHQRNGFINNYTIFYQAEDGKEFSKTVNSSILRCDLESLTRKTSYTVRVMASTSAGGANGPGISFKTLSISVFEIFLVTSLVGGGLLILILLTVAYGIKKPNKLKHLCWPDVPNPAESSIATWCGDDFKGKLNLKKLDNSVYREEDRILKPCSSPNGLIDKLVVNFENFLEVVSAEHPGKGWENILGGEKNEYVTSPNRPYCPTVSTEIPPRGSQCLCPGMLEETCSETREQLLPPAQGFGPGHLCEEGASNPYLKNSVTTREFLVSEKLPEQIQREV
ncbi:interleukin-31 receptor subunit alpha [Muntiacus reevesi]|uniref:interleukin-31 receptor subunit alpha n=1 Tax=Muntiacus reevesi TaxID=9886 RepID=UPI00330776B1